MDYLLAKIHRELHKRGLGVSNEMMEIFMKYRWPGNVRELENHLTRAVVVAKGQVLVRSDFPELTEEPSTAPEAKPGDILGEAGALLTLDAVEERYIRKVLKENSGQKQGGSVKSAVSLGRLRAQVEKYADLRAGIDADSYGSIS